MPGSPTRTVTFHAEPVLLYKVLKLENLVASGGEAKFLIQTGQVRVNGTVDTRKRRRLRHGDQIELAGQILMIQVDEGTGERQSRLLSRARELGVSDARFIRADQIPIDPKFAGFCREPGCPGFGTSMSCPPHVMGPAKFTAYVKRFTDLLVFKFDVPWDILLSPHRLEINRVLHDTAATLERFARDIGYDHARGLAGGCCKELFCADHPACRVLSGEGGCRHPDQSRESMSGMGVDFKTLAGIAGWEIHRSPGSGGDTPSFGLMAGSVLLSESSHDTGGTTSIQPCFVVTKNQ